MVDLDVVGAVLLGGVFFGQADAAVLERREHRRRHVLVVGHLGAVVEQALQTMTPMESEWKDDVTNDDVPFSYPLRV